MWFIYLYRNQDFLTRILIISKIPESALIYNQDYNALASRFRQWVNINQFFTSVVAILPALCGITVSLISNDLSHVPL